MGLWNRFWSSLTGRENGRSSSIAASPRRSTWEHGGGGTTAVLDAPSGKSVSDYDSSSLTPDDAAERAIWWAPEGVTETEGQWIGPVDLCHEARALEHRLISHFDGHDLQMPPMPRVAERVLKRLRDPKCQMADIARELADDQVTAADVLRIANSVLYRGTQKITTLQAAVTRLGTRVIRTLMLHQSLRAVTFPRKSGVDNLAKMIWRRSLAGACVMRELAELLGEDSEDAFVIGLLHDIGNVIVLRMVCEQESLTKHRFDVDTFEYLCFETHQELGELIAEQWQLPESLRSLIANHHGEPPMDDPHRRRRSMLMLADMILQMLDLAPRASYDLLNTPAAKELGLNGKPNVIKLLTELPAKIEESIAELQ